jgi:hypothetical protein
MEAGGEFVPESAVAGEVIEWVAYFRYWHFSDMAAMADDVRSRGYSGSRRSTRFHHRGVARFQVRKYLERR